MNVLSIAYVAVFAGVIALTLWTRAVAEAGPAKAGLFTAPDPASFKLSMHSTTSPSTP